MHDVWHREIRKNLLIANVSRAGRSVARTGIADRETCLRGKRRPQVSEVESLSAFFAPRRSAATYT